jgi:SulP family sulfate permease
MNIQTILGRMRTNWKSGVTVALVSIPLSISLAVASQSTPTAGIITAIWAGLLASIFGGSKFNIVGPTGALSGILATYAIVHGANALSMLAIITGVFVMLAFLFRLEKFLVFIPGSAVQGFTLGVAFTIAFNQFNFALGLVGLPKHETFIQNLFESFRHIGSLNPQIFGMFLVFLAAMFVLLKFVPKIPGAITLSVIGVIIGYFAQNGTIHLAVQTLGARYPDMAPKLFQMPTFFFDSSLVTVGLTVAVVAILETMLSAKIADGMTKTKHDKRKELIGLSLANIASGVMGGIPATAALARTSLNIKTGADSQVSARISSVSIAIISIFLLTTFRYIPLSVIAAILVFVAYRMIEHEHFIRMFKHDKKSFAIAFVVAVVTVWVDPIVGIMLGTAISLLIFMEKLSRGQFELIINDEKRNIIDKVTSETLDKIEKEGETIIYSIKGQLAYINSQSHVMRFEQSLNGYKSVIIRLRELSLVDLDGIDAFNEIVSLIKAQGKAVLVSGASPLVAELLEESAEYKKLQKEGMVFKRTNEALKALGY